MNTSFISDNHTQETCPECAVEITIKANGLSECPECGHKDILPCMECNRYNDYELCDWNAKDGCTPFPHT